MTRKVLWRCIIVSAVAALAAPLATMQVGAPAEGETVIDLSSLSAKELASATPDEAARLMQAAPTRTLHGWERLRYPFTHPQLANFYFMAAVAIFPFVFLATLIVSFLNTRGAVAQQAAPDGWSS